MSERPSPAVDRLVKVMIGTAPDQVTFISEELSQTEAAEMIGFLQANKDVFAWSVAEMPGIDPSVACHRLDIKEGSRPIRQRPRRMAPDRKLKVNEEIAKLLSVGFIRPVTYPSWVSNIVAVPKKDGKIRV